jgi:hypothetical protein
VIEANINNPEIGDMEQDSICDLVQWLWTWAGRMRCAPAFVVVTGGNRWR